MGVAEVDPAIRRINQRGPDVAGAPSGQRL